MIGPGMLDVDFRQIRLPDGESYRIAGSATSLDSHSVQRTSDGRMVARSTKSNDKTKFIAYGAGAGFLIGSLLGSNIKGGSWARRPAISTASRKRAKATAMTWC